MTTTMTTRTAPSDYFIFNLRHPFYCVSSPVLTLHSDRSVDLTIGGYQRKGELDYDLLAKLVMVLTRGPAAVTETPPKEGAGE